MMPNGLPASLPTGHPVRIVGRFKAYHPYRLDTFILEYKGASVLVDTGNVEPRRFEEISQMEVYGDVMAREGDDVIVDARIVRSINDADLNIYERLIPILTLKRSQNKTLQ